MIEFIMGFIFGMTVMLGFLGWFYIPKIIELRDELAMLKIDLIHK